MAEAVFEHIAKPPGKPPHPLIGRIDSAGTGGWHIGYSPDPRTMSTLEDHNIEYQHKARKFDVGDFNEFDYVLAMDKDNLRHLNLLRSRAAKGEISRDDVTIQLFGDFGGKAGEEVIDPYYGARDGFDIAYEQMQRFSRGFLEALERKAASQATRRQESSS
jgi:low molecular weight phosphotyrosine protein phosphatase